ncbi:MAG: hypothetical protein K2Y18_02430 [Alphaproteobacteria bacterium]|jgi:hypothetical protein|nr:hypothetical protein [Alphaproteobacteria bacterium]
MHKSLGYLAALGSVLFIDSAHANCATSCESALSTTTIKKITEAHRGSTVEWKGQQWNVEDPTGFPTLPTRNRLFLGENKNDRLVCYYDVSYKEKREALRLAISIKFCEDSKEIAGHPPLAIEAAPPPKGLPQITGGK